MQAFDKAVVSLPDSKRHGRTPFGAPIVIHATAAETGGAFGMWETITPPGRGPARHMHTRETEIFRVIAGTYRFWCGDEEPFDAPVGTVVALPPHVPHHWINISDVTGQMMAIVTPGGCEQLFIDIAKLEAITPEAVGLIEAGLGIVNDVTKAMAGRA